MAKKKKSLFDRALGGGSRKKKRRGMADLAWGGGKSKSRSGMLAVLESRSKSKSGKGGNDLSRYLGFANRRGRKSDWRAAAMVGKTLSRKLTPTERLEAQDAIEAELDRDPGLRAVYEDERLIGNEGFLRRLVRLARERIGLFVGR